MPESAEIIVVRRLHNSIYKSEGGGKAVVFSRHAGGPRGLSNAITSHHRERNTAKVSFGSIGCGAGWVEVVPSGGEPGDGFRLDHPLFGLDADYIPKPPIGGAPWEWWRQQRRALAVAAREQRAHAQ